LESGNPALDAITPAINLFASAIPMATRDPPDIPAR
jgi:hypothetical protein